MGNSIWSIFALLPFLGGGHLRCVAVVNFIGSPPRRPPFGQSLASAGKIYVAGKLRRATEEKGEGWRGLTRSKQRINDGGREGGEYKLLT